MHRINQLRTLFFRSVLIHFSYTHYPLQTVRRTIGSTWSQRSSTWPRIVSEPKKLVLPNFYTFIFFLLASSISFFWVKSFILIIFFLQKVASFFGEKKLCLFFLHFLELKTAGGNFIFHQTRVLLLLHVYAALS